MIRSDPLSSQALAKDDVVKIHIGAHIDGFAAISAETLVVGATESDPVTGRRADVLQAAWHAAQVAMRLVKVGNKNWAITDAVNKGATAWKCHQVEGMYMYDNSSEPTFLTYKGRYDLVPTDTKCYRWQETDHPQP
jgi:methionine aminopeptidase